VAQQRSPEENDLAAFPVLDGKDGVILSIFTQRAIL
jgi:hypothetical protein